MLSFRSEFDKKVHEILEDIKKKNDLIYSSISYAYGSGGKRVRPTLCLLCSEIIVGQGVKVPENYKDHILIGAICVEFLHTASLMIDDVIDNSYVRRGKPSTNAVFGNKVAVTSASYLVGLTSKMVADIGNMELIRRFSETSSLMAEGEVLEFSIMVKTASDLSKDVVLRNYIEVIQKKTAPLFSLSSSIPPIIYSENYAHTKSFSNLGFLIGVAFQIKDDILDFSPSFKTGKPFMKDIREGKITLPVILSDNYEKIVSNILMMNSRGDCEDAEIPDTFVDGIYDLVVAGGGIDRSEKYLMNIRSDIHSLIDKDLFAPKRRELLEFVRFLVEREH